MGNAITMPGDAVRAIAIEIDPHGVEADAVARRQRDPTVVEPMKCGSRSAVELLPGCETWFVHLAVVHPAAPLAPRNVMEQLIECLVGARKPAWAMVNPGVRIEIVALQPSKVRVHERTLVCPQ